MERCLRCGGCCMFIATPPVLPQQLAKMPAPIRQVIEWFDANIPDRSEAKIPCYFYDAAHQRCAIEKNQPLFVWNSTPGARRVSASACGSMVRSIRPRG